MKNKLFFVGAFLVFLNHSNAMNEEKDQDKNQAHSVTLIKLPKNMIIHIASFLYEEDFHNFSLTTSTIKNHLMTYSLFFPLERKEEAISLIQSIPIGEDNSEVLKKVKKTFSRTPKKKLIPGLRALVNQSKDFSDFGIANPDFKKIMKNFKIYLKTLTLRKEFQDPLYESETRKFISNTEDDLYSIKGVAEKDQKNQEALEKYRFYWKKAAFLDKNERENMIIFIQESTFPFHENIEKYRKWTNLEVWKK